MTNAAIYNKDESYNLFPLTFLYRLLGVMACLVYRYVEQRYPESISNVTTLANLANIRTVLIDSRVAGSSKQERDGQTSK